MLSMDRATQLEEIDALKSIYYSEEIQVDETTINEKLHLTFWAFAELPETYTIKYKESFDSKEPSYFKVKHLPPIKLLLSLPQDYPSKRAPDLNICCQWLHKKDIVQLCKKLDEIWLENENMEIIYSWTDFLKNDSLKFLGYETELDITNIYINHLHYVDMKMQWKLNPRNGRPKRQLKARGNPSKEPTPTKTVPLTSEKGPRKKIWRSRRGECSAEGSYATNSSNTIEKKDGSDNPAKATAQTTGKVTHRKRIQNPYRNGYPVPNRSQGDKCSFDRRAVLNLPLSVSPVKLLEIYTTERSQIEFLKNCYTCNICFTDKLGKDCTKFKDCDHVFCIDCVRSYFTVRIKEGTVLSIKCPNEKCDSEALPSQIKEIVSEELFAKYDSVLLSTALDTFNDIIYCPRPVCQYPVSWEPEDKMATCPYCQYAFCVYCRTVYHGIEPCKFKSEERQKLVESYQNASPEIRIQMETRYGKKTLENMVHTSMTESWIKDNSKSCPHCDAAIEKSQGCNKMVCWKCNTHFCWLCGTELDPKNPYLHFNDPNSRCVNKLFHLVPMEEDEEWENWDWVDVSEESDSSDLELDTDTDSDSDSFD